MPLFRESGGSLTELGKILRESGGSLTEIDKVYRESGGSLTLVYTRTTPPAAPSSLSATTFDDQRIDLSWTNNDTYDDIQIYRDGSLHDTIGGGNTSYSDLSSVDSGTQYCYTVRGCTTADGCSSSSNQDCATTDIDPPSSLLASGGDGQVNLTWSNGSPDYQEIEVHRCTGSGCTSHSLLHTITNGSATSYTDSNVTNGTTYSYKIRGIGNDANSSFSNTNEATPQSVSPETLRPDSDRSILTEGTGEWTEGGSGSDNDGEGWDEIDESSADDSTTWIGVTANNCNTESDNHSVNLQNPSNAHDNTQTHRIAVRTFKFSFSDSGSYTATCTLRDGGTTIESFDMEPSSNGSWETITHDLTTTEIDNIGDYNDLNLLFNVSVTSNDPGTGCAQAQFRVTQAYLDIF